MIDGGSGSPLASPRFGIDVLRGVVRYQKSIARQLVGLSHLHRSTNSRITNPQFHNPPQFLRSRAPGLDRLSHIGDSSPALALFLAATLLSSPEKCVFMHLLDQGPELPGTGHPWELTQLYDVSTQVSIRRTSFGTKRRLTRTGCQLAIASHLRH